MKQEIGRYWWVFLIQGISSVLYGILAMTWPGLTVVILISIYGAFAIFYGLLGMFRAVSIRKTCRQWWLGLLGGLFGLIAGVLVYAYPGLTALLLVYFIAAWALVTGVSNLFQAFDKTYEPGIRGVYAGAGLASVLFAVLLYAIGPARGIIALVWLLGIHAFVLGIGRLVGAVRLRAIHKQLSAT